jgi:hypothetical protein
MSAVPLTPLQITQEIQLAKEVILFAESESIDLVLLRHEVRACARRTFGNIIHDDLWQNIEHSARESVRTTILENMYRFRRKQCSDPLDVAYSVASMSIDGAQLQIDYSITVSQLVRNVLRLQGDELCSWRAAKVLHTLLPLEAEKYIPSEPLMDVEAHLFGKSVDQGKCHSCSATLDLAPFRARGLSLGRTYVHCLLCRHERDFKVTTYGHLIVAENSLRTGSIWEGGDNGPLRVVEDHEKDSTKEKDKQEWSIILYGHLSQSGTLEGCHVIPTFGPSAQSVVARLSFHALRRVMSDNSPPSLELDTHTSIPHEPNCGWRLVE